MRGDEREVARLVHFDGRGAEASPSALSRAMSFAVDCVTAGAFASPSMTTSLGRRAPAENSA